MRKSSMIFLAFLFLLVLTAISWEREISFAQTDLLPTPSPLSSSYETDVKASVIWKDAPSIVIKWKTLRPTLGWVEVVNQSGLSKIVYDVRGRNVTDTFHWILIHPVKQGEVYFYTIFIDGEKNVNHITSDQVFQIKVPLSPDIAKTPGKLPLPQQLHSFASPEQGPLPTTQPKRGIWMPLIFGSPGGPQPEAFPKKQDADISPTNLLSPAMCSAESLDAYLHSKGSPLTGTGNAHVASGQQYNIDPRLVVAIAGAESTFGKNGSCATQRHNAWGYGGGWPQCWNFNSWAEGIQQVSWQLRNYIDVHGLTNIHTIGQRWCGSGCTYWETNVRTFYAEQGGNPDTNDLSFSGACGNAGGANVTVQRVWTTDHNGNAKTSFAPGDEITYHALIHNSGSQMVSAAFVWEATGPGTAFHWSGNLDIDPGDSSWYANTSIPDDAPPGNYTFRVTATYNGRTSSETSTFTVEGGGNASCLIQSPHPYANDYDHTWTLTNPDGNAAATRVHFRRLETEEGYDFVYVQDGSNRQVSRFTGDYSSGVWSDPVPGRTVKVQLTSDYSVTAWGFCIDRIETVSGGQPPAAPSNLRATPLDGSHIRLEWNDNSDNESGFKIYDGDSLVASVDTNVTVYTVGGLAPNSYHCYHVRAFNEFGDSGWTDWACASTQVSSCPSDKYLTKYFNNPTLSGSPQWTTCEDWPINHDDWGHGGPGHGINNDNFSAQWTGRAHFDEGDYTFIARADDGIRVWIDNERILNEWRDQAAREFRVTRHVNAGNHSIKVEYYEHTGEAVAQFRWEQHHEPPPPPTPPIEYREEGATHIIRINLRDSRVHFRVAIAHNDQGGRETVQSMAQRYGAILAINGDYFDPDRSNDNYWSWPWPQGMTWINGIDRTYRCQDHPTNCSYWRADWWRSSLAISRDNHADIGRMEQRRDSPNNYNVIAGGPQFIRNGQFVWDVRDRGNDCTINDEPFPRQNCPYYTKTRMSWTAVGITQDGNTLVIIVGPNMKPQDVMSKMLAEGVFNAIKLDGGGSSTLYYDGRVRFGGGREVVDSLLVFLDR